MRCQCCWWIEGLAATSLGETWNGAPLADQNGRLVPSQCGRRDCARGQFECLQPLDVPVKVRMTSRSEEALAPGVETGGDWAYLDYRDGS